MIVEHYVDVQGHSDEVIFKALRCTNCGEVIDRVVLENRLKPDPHSFDGPRKRKFAQRTIHSVPDAGQAGDRSHDSSKGKSRG